MDVNTMHIIRMSMKKRQWTQPNCSIEKHVPSTSELWVQCNAYCCNITLSFDTNTCRCGLVMYGFSLSPHNPQLSDRLWDWHVRYENRAPHPSDCNGSMIEVAFLNTSEGFCLTGNNLELDRSRSMNSNCSRFSLLNYSKLVHWNFN